MFQHRCMHGGSALLMHCIRDCTLAKIAMLQQVHTRSPMCRELTLWLDDEDVRRALHAAPVEVTGPFQVDHSSSKVLPNGVGGTGVAWTVDCCNFVLKLC